MKKIFIMLSLAYAGYVQAQEITEVKGLRLYDHHSSEMTSMPFGYGAEGSKSGYDFVSRSYYGSFDDATFGMYSNGEEKNLDMVEHGGMFGAQSNSKYLGFTSSVSSIWSGKIKGNEQTKWHKVANGAATYDGLKTKAALIALYDASKAVFSIDEVKDNEVYIGRIRGSGLYVLIKCTGSRQPFGQPDGSMDNSYFNFDYKYNGTGVTGIDESIKDVTISAFPNPASDHVTIRSEATDLSGATITMADAMGREVYTGTTVGKEAVINTSGYDVGLYSVKVKIKDSVKLLNYKILIQR